MDNVLSLLGICYRARKTILGEDVLHSLKKIKFLFIANDASDNTKERYLKKCEFYKIPYTLKYSSEEISSAIGKTNSKIVGTDDLGFSKSFIDKLK